MKTKRASQSLMKEVQEYLNKEKCGLVMQSKWIDDDYPDVPTDEQALGSYFEYILTGALPRSGEIPRADYYKKATDALPKGKNPWDDNGFGNPILGPQDMLKPYALAHFNADRVKGYFKEMGLRIVEAGVRKVKGKLEGTIDIIAEETTLWKRKEPPFDVVENKRLIVIDVKYSGMLDEAWSKHGWAWTDNRSENPPMWIVEQRDYHAKQARQYHYLTDLPFYFLIVSSKNEHDVKFVHVTMNSFTLEQHVIEAKDSFSKLQLFEKTGFVAYPDVVRCSKCPLKGRCEKKSDFPVATHVDVSIPD